MWRRIPSSRWLSQLLRETMSYGGNGGRILCSSCLSPQANVAQLPPTNSNSTDNSALADSIKSHAPTSHESPSFLFDSVAQKFINMMMWDGKKSVSQRILKEALQIIKSTQLSKMKSKGVSGTDVVTDPLAIFHHALESCKPVMGTSGVRRGGKLYHVPYPLPPKRRQFLASRWIIHAARDRSGHSMPQKLATELLEAYNNQGTAIKKKQDLHRLAEANRAFAHFRW